MEKERQVIDLISDNFHLHASKIPDLSNEMSLHSLPHIMYVDSGLSCDTFNIIYIHHPDLTKEELNQALDHFQSRNLDYCMWINKENLTSNIQILFNQLKIEKQASEVGMAMQFEHYQYIENVNHLSIRQVNDRESLKVYSRVIAENWSPTDQNVITYYSRTANHYLDPNNNIKLYIYYYEDQPVSCVELFPTNSETVGFYGFATLEAYRGKGIGTTLLTFALNRAKELGYKNAILQGTEDGLNIYKKFGFKDYTTYYEFV
ncbi:GNAT family N-acetyltransferase [Ekhidna sp.]|uniref:GNAT family N-acetyltransferase n=1 Tax=Ekhidna sp. TaxID=2608089 RepID=UPI0032982AD9